MRVRTPHWAALFLFSIIPFLLPASARAQYGDPPGSIARIGYLSGDVSLEASGTDEWDQAPVNYPMASGDRLYTGGGARAVVQLGGAELRIWQLTDVSFVNQTDQYQQIGLASGNLRLRVFQMDPGSQIEVDTPNGAVIVESPGDYRIEAFPQNGSSIVSIASGNAEITGPGINQPLSSGYSIGLFGIEPVELQYLDVPEYDNLDYWSFDLDRRLQNSISARYVSRQMVGYGDLDANGTWQPDSEYGPVWYPNNVPYGWRPYSTGHWAYVRPWGYTWVDDAPWGFAPFHYGRWAIIDGRWGWVPGPPAVRPVYSPALVAFVGGGPGPGGPDGDLNGGDRDGGDRERGGRDGGGISISIGLAGGVGIAAWFPIGVGEPYVPWYRCSPNYARQVNVTNVNVAAIRNTTVVNNYNTYINKTVINNTTINNTTVNNTTVNNTVVNNFNYANKAQVTAVPASAMATGAPVARQAVQLSHQQRQQIAAAPVAMRPTAPIPVRQHPSLVPAVVAVARPAARPLLMTPTGQARAVPAAVTPHPVAIAALPVAKVVSKNAPPPPAAPKPMPAVRLAAGSASVAAAPVAARPAATVTQPAAAVQPAATVVRPATTMARPTTPVTPPTAPAKQVVAAPQVSPAPAMQPSAQSTRSAPAVKPVPATQAVPYRPEAAPVVRPGTEARPETAPVVRPQSAPSRADIAPAARPAPQAAPKPQAASAPAGAPPASAPIVRQAPQQRPAPLPAQVPPHDAVKPVPAVKPAPATAARPNDKPASKPGEKPAPKDSQKDQQKDRPN